MTAQPAKGKRLRVGVTTEPHRRRRRHVDMEKLFAGRKSIAFAEYVKDFGRGIWANRTMNVR